MTDTPQTTARVPEWALRRGLAIASRAFPERADEPTWQRWAALGADIAEALYYTAPPIGGGIGKCCLVCQCSGRDYAGEKTDA